MARRAYSATDISSLTERQRKFVVIKATQPDLTNAECYSRAGFTGALKSLQVNSTILMRDPRIRAAIERVREHGEGALNDGVQARVPMAAIPFKPQPGPQTMFDQTTADIAIYGGAAGGGKSFALLYDAAKYTRHPNAKSYRAVMFRRTSPELTGGGGLWDESQSMYRALGGVSRSSPTLDWTFESDTRKFEDQHRIEMRHLVREDSVEEHRSRQYARAYFDELQTFTARQFWFLLSRLRTMSGVPTAVRASCNPDPDSFVAKLVEWWIDGDGWAIPERSGIVRWFVRSGEQLYWYDSRRAAEHAHPRAKPLSFTFIAARLQDNLALQAADPGYQARLEALDTVDRARLLGDERRGGNWHVRPSSGLVLPRAKFKRSSGPPSKPTQWVRFWDRAANAPSDVNRDPDWTEGALIALCEDGELWIDDLVSLRDRAPIVNARIREEALRDGMDVTVGLWQDLAGAGQGDVDAVVAELPEFVVEIISSGEGIERGKGGRGKAKLVHARAWSKQLESGLVHVNAHAAWTERLISQCDNFPGRGHDDIVDAVSGGMTVLLGMAGSFLDQVHRAAAANKQGR